MRSLLFLFAVLLGATLRTPAQDFPAKYQLSGSKEFSSLKRPDAEVKGQALATADFKEGLYRILVFGLRVLDPNEKRLRQDYNVYTVGIAGCVVDEGIVGGAESYNRTMKALLTDKYKKDIFAEPVK